MLGLRRKGYIVYAFAIFVVIMLVANNINIIVFETVTQRLQKSRIRFSLLRDNVSEWMR